MLKGVLSGLRCRVLLMLGLCLLLAIAAGGALSLQVLEQRFDAFERQQSRSALDSCAILLAEQLQLLGRFAGDYGIWDDTYRFMASGGDEYVAATYTEAALGNMDADLVLLVDPAGQVRLAAEMPRLSGRQGGLQVGTQPGQLAAALLAQAELPAQGSRTRVVFLAQQAYLLGSAPIVRSDGSGAVRGYVLMARWLDAQRLGNLQRIAGETFRVIPPGKVTDDQVTLGADATRAVRQNAEMVSRGYGLQLDRPRLLSAERRMTSWLLLGNLLLIWGLALGLVMLALSRMVLERLQGYCARLLELRVANSRVRLDAGAEDEIGQLGQTINELLDRIDHQHLQLRHEATHDALTGLANRVMLAERIKHALLSLRVGEAGGLALLLVDLDGFKMVNDVHGHPAGDALLIELSRRIDAMIRTSDCAARLGGDEFAVLLSELDTVQSAMQLAERIRIELCRPVALDGEELAVSASIGVLFMPQRYAGHLQPAQLLKQADIAMYKAKQDGRDRVVLFNDAMEHMLEEQARLEHDLRQAIADGGIQVWFQPIISADGNHLECIELLGRWHHPQLGDISPGRFIPIAEQAHLMRDYTLRFLLKAGDLLAPLVQQRPGLRVSLNISVQELLEPHFVEDLQSILAASQFPARQLNLELTESLLASNEAELLGPMRKCRMLGIDFHIDDFGTGYSSLARLHSLPLHLLKIDRAFVMRIGQGGDKLIRAIIEMAHALGLPVVCEGVETAEQAEAIGRMGGDYLQGFHFAKPMPLALFPQWLTAFDG
ncbi:putative bifunctional diguanylate cyclase/phosphodiesterase [Chitinilyticum piscinae]|uniref:EAL domain-containing protein n=1 Tax=Chitinilyticum piscinae TaxID=2866724 RepID=A0A8J7FWH1_9NEIS|nr:EAL domain-containing protein [Chitinilyticum piscinae]MBE9608120.1 EAL domain-containing protein [Chitinilyticum piscinae]